MENKNLSKTKKAENFKIENTYAGHLLNKIEMKFCRIVTGARKYASNIGIRSELGRYPLHIEIIKRIMRYKLYLLKSEEGSLLHDAFKTNEELNRSGIQTWSSWTEFITKELDMTDNGLSKTSIASIVNKLKCNYKSYWQQQIHNDARNAPGQKNKLRTYRKFKLEFEHEKYWDVLTDRSERKQLCNFRLGVHKLHIETGRYHPYIPADDRICHSCVNQIEAVEDEIHFIMGCPKHNKLRSNLFSIAKKESAHFDSFNNYQKFVWLMASKNTNIINGLSKYIKAAMANRVQNCK